MTGKVSLTTCRLHPRLGPEVAEQCSNPTEITLEVYGGFPLVLCRECATMLRDELTKELEAL